jgi:hypothetical protein
MLPLSRFRGTDEAPVKYGRLLRFAYGVVEQDGKLMGQAIMAMGLSVLSMSVMDGVRFDCVVQIM